MNINLQIDDFRNNLVNMINESGLPIGVVELVVKEVYTKVQNAYIATINSEKLKDMQSPDEIKKEIQEEADKVNEALNHNEEIFGNEQN